MPARTCPQDAACNYLSYCKVVGVCWGGWHCTCCTKYIKHAWHASNAIVRGHLRRRVHHMICFMPAQRGALSNKIRHPTYYPFLRPRQGTRFIKTKRKTILHGINRFCVFFVPKRHRSGNEDFNVFSSVVSFFVFLSCTPGSPMIFF